MPSFLYQFIKIYEIVFSCDRDLLSGGVFSTCVMSGGLSKIRNYSSAINSQLQTALRTVKSNRKLWQNGDEVLHGKINPVNSSGMLKFIISEKVFILEKFVSRKSTLVIITSNFKSSRLIGQGKSNIIVIT